MQYVQPVGGLANDPYLDANPVGGIEGSPVPAAAIEHPMRELVALITDAGLAPTGATLTQVATAVRALMQRQAASISVAGGTADAITAAYTPAIAALVNGMTLYVRPSAANTVIAPTFTPTSPAIAAKPIVKGAGAALAVGDIAGAGHWLKLQYDATLDKWVLANPATGVVTGITQAQGDARYCGIGYMLVQHQLAQNTSGGSATAGIQTRVLNTVVANTISGASLASNQFTLPAGTYRVRAFAEAFHVNVSKIALYNVTDAVYVQQGGSINGENTLADLLTSELSLFGRFSLASSKVLELRQYCEASYATSGLGYPSNSMGVEVYAGVEITKES